MHNCSILLILRVEVTDEKEIRYSRMQKAQALCKIQAIAQKAESNHVWINHFFLSIQAREKKPVVYAIAFLFCSFHLPYSPLRSKANQRSNERIYIRRKKKLPVERHEVIAEQGEPPQRDRKLTQQSGIL